MYNRGLCRCVTSALTQKRAYASGNEFHDVTAKLANKPPNIRKHPWSNIKKQRKRFEDIAIRLNIMQLDQWYNISKVDVLDKYGSKGIFEFYNGSLRDCFNSLYPGHEWKLWLFKTCWGYRSSKKEQKKIFNHLAEHLDIKELESWCSVCLEDVYHFDVEQLIRSFYNGSMFKALSVLYPYYDWNERNFNKAPRMFWSKKSNQEKTLDDVGELFGIKHLDDWYNIRRSDALEFTGTLQSKLYGSMESCLKAVYPHHKWDHERFTHKPIFDESNQRTSLEFIGKRLGVKELEGWYNVDKAEIIVQGGKGILDQHNQSLFECMQSLYPHFAWEKRSWKTSYWQTSLHQQAFLERVKRATGVKTPSMWYNVSHQQLADLGGRGLIRYWPYVLKSIEPNFPWVWRQFRGLKKYSKQKELGRAIASIFPSCEIIEEASISLRSGSYTVLSVDLYIPAQNLAFEYQGEQHYKDIFKWNPTEVQQTRDAEKSAQCEAVGISLVQIPYWWDTTVEQLVATIKHFAPHVNIDTNLQGNARPLIDSPTVTQKVMLTLPQHITAISS